MFLESDVKEVYGVWIKLFYEIWIKLFLNECLICYLKCLYKWLNIVNWLFYLYLESLNI